jgi:hypothetical protein
MSTSDLPMHSCTHTHTHTHTHIYDGRCTLGHLCEVNETGEWMMSLEQFTEMLGQNANEDQLQVLRDFAMDELQV